MKNHHILDVITCFVDLLIDGKYVFNRENNIVQNYIIYIMNSKGYLYQIRDALNNINRVPDRNRRNMKVSCAILTCSKSNIFHTLGVFSIFGDVIVFP